jgi:hypothetical protein
MGHEGSKSVSRVNSIVFQLTLEIIVFFISFELLSMAWRCNMVRGQSSVHRRCFVGGSEGGVIMGDEQGALLHLWREKRGEAEPDDLSGKTSPSQPLDCARAKPSAGPVLAAHVEFVAALAEHPPRPIPLDADAVDLEDRANHLGRVLSALSVYVAVILDDTSQNVPGGLDIRDAQGVLADLASDLTGTIQHAADSMAGWVA